VSDGRPAGTRRFGRRATGLVALALVGAFVTPGVSAAHTTGLNGWYWPTGTSSTGSCGGWLQYRSWNRSIHLAKDVRARVGSPVYALTDGYVYAAYAWLSGYGPGGAMIVVYKDAQGKPFKALYGHVRAIAYRRGQRVKAGAVLARIAPCGGTPHLHFGIHPGLARPNDPRRNPFMGHSTVKGRTYGWVDPVGFLKTAYPWGTVVVTEPTSTPVPTVASPVPIPPAGS
jgi:murein DD-endopeptidase MepM/ murein hydrolase activator NlpD